MAAPMAKFSCQMRKFVYRFPRTVFTVDFAQLQQQRPLHSQSLQGKTIRIGCASGFWGDTPTAAPQLIYGGNLDFLVFDYLSEITMSLLAAAKQKMPNMGYTPDFVQAAIGPYLKDIKAKGIRVVSNAGGVNLPACSAALKEAAKKAGVDLNVVTITGDDLMPKIQEIKSLGIKEMESGKTFPDTVQSMNAYLGAGAIARALKLGADIVVTGRCTDSAMVLGPLMNQFGWKEDDHDLLASGSLAGHLIECGAQATGGIFTDWKEVKQWENIGFPIVECSSNGDFILTKPPKTGGLVTKATVGEQLVYEIGDPSCYILPDICCDFSQVQIQNVEGKEGTAVYVSGAKGKPMTPDYKVSATYPDGYRMTAVFSIGGPEAAAKGRKTVQAILARTKGIFKKLKLEDFSKIHVQALGAEDTYGPHANVEKGPREVVMWVAVKHTQKQALQLFTREIAAAGTGMAPGLTGIVGGRPKVSPVLKLFSFLLPKDKLKIEIHMNGEHVEDYTMTSQGAPLEQNNSNVTNSDTPCDLKRGSHSYRLEDLAYARSGDKGNSCNIGVIARDPAFLPYISEALTEASVALYFEHVFEDYQGPVESNVSRYELPGIGGLNFLLRNALGGGGIASLRSDPQGKAYAQMLLDYKIDNMPSLEDL